MEKETETNDEIVANKIGMISMQCHTSTADNTRCREAEKKEQKSGQIDKFTEEKCYMLGVDNEVFVEIPIEDSKNGKIILLVDSEADSSLVKKSALRPETKIKDMFQKNLKGAFGGYTKTLGEITVTHEELNGITFNFHVVGDATTLPADGVLGRDNIWNSTVINYRRRELVFYGANNCKILKCPLISLESINVFI